TSTSRSGASSSTISSVGSIGAGQVSRAPPGSQRARGPTVQEIVRRSRQARGMLSIKNGWALLLLIAPVAAAGCGSSSGHSSTSSGGSAASGPAATTPSSSTTAASGSASPGALSGEVASAATGDIPDNQVFLVFHNNGAGYSIKYPEGWTQQ